VLWDSIQSKLCVGSPSTGYGASEASLCVTHTPPGQRPSEDGEIGFALPHFQMGNKLSIGLELRGPSVCTALIQNGQIKTPDHILLRDDIYKRPFDSMYIYRGRLELVLNRGGTKFSLEHIEEVLFEQLGIGAVCVKVPSRRLGEELGVVTSKGARRDQIYRVLKTEFAHTFNSNNFLQMDTLPLNTHLKIDRQRCLNLLMEQISDQEK